MLDSGIQCSCNRTMRGKLRFFFTNSWLSDAGKGLKMGESSRHRWFLVRPLNSFTKSSLRCNTVTDCIKTSFCEQKKRVYNLIFHHQKCVYRHNNNIKPKKAKSFSDIVVKNDVNGISNKLDKFQCNYTSLFKRQYLRLYMEYMEHLTLALFKSLRCSYLEL